jgi:predicted transcriptional regulator
MHGSDIKMKRREAAIPGAKLCAESGISRSRLSDIERGYVAPRRDEIARICSALDRLTEAKQRIDALALEVGWTRAVAPTGQTVP